jgi:hypothetical protein
MRPKMSKSTQARPIAIGYAARRPVRSGSVMIMVVALLVLLSLIGMAYVATARSDRTAAAQNAVNGRSDIMHFGVVELVKHALASGAFGPDYRQASPYRNAAGNLELNYAHYDSPWVPALPSPTAPWQDYRGDAWLADRVPDYLAPSYRWRYISGPLISGPLTNGPKYFEDPVTLEQWPQRTNMIIGVTLDGRYPGLRLAPNSPPITAVDNDSDGMPDGLPFRLNVGPVDGLTWYASTRIVDNCAAINAAVAWKRIDSNAGPTDAFYPALFPTNVELEQIRRSNSDMANLQIFRTGDSAQRTNPVPIDDSGIQHTDFFFSPGAGNTGSTQAQWMQLGRRLDFPGYNGFNTRYQRLPVGDTLGMAAGFVVHTPKTGLSVTETTLFDTLQTSNPAPYQLTTADIVAWGQNFRDLHNPPTLSDPEYSRRPLIVPSNPVANVIQPHYYNTLSPSGLTGDRFDVPHEDMLPYFPAGRFRGLWQQNPTPPYIAGDIVEVQGVSPTNNVPPNISPSFAATFICTQAPSQTISPLDPKTQTWRKHWEYQPWTTVPVKASLNTATFRELFRAYFNVMCNDVVPLNSNNPTSISPFFVSGAAPSTSIYDSRVTANPHRMFRSSLRDNTDDTNDNKLNRLRFDPANQLQLRAALAAVNTIDLRDADYSITSRTLHLQAKRGTNPVNVDVTVYGCERQPFITEVYVNTLPLEDPTDSASKANKHGFIAIELFNPYSVPIVIKRTWELGRINRHPNRVTNTYLTLENLNPSGRQSTFAATDILINPGAYVVLHNYLQGSTNAYDAAFVPKQKFGGAAGSVKAVWAAQAGRDFYVPNLGRVISDSGGQEGWELVLLRPRNEDGLLRSSTSAGNPSYETYNENANGFISDLVPVDQFDFTGIQWLKVSNLLTEDARVLHYVRESDINTGPGGKRWKCVYPGRYHGNIINLPNQSRHDQAEIVHWTALTEDATTKVQTAQPSASVLIRDPNLGFSDSTANYGPDFVQGIKLFDSADDVRGTIPIGTTLNLFPFGGFARIGDIYKVPFIGAYRVRQLNQIGTDDFLELNSISMDSAFADDGDDSTNNNQQENIGRFTPLGDPVSGSFDYAANEQVPGGIRYLWARDLLDYFTVIAPNDAYFADTDGNPVPDLNKYDNNGASGKGTVAYRYHVQGQPMYSNILNNTPTNGKLPGQPQPVLDKDYASGERSRDVPVVEGLINVNTAPWRVLATLPMIKFTFPVTNLPDYAAQNKLAHDIVDYRNTHGPFRSLTDLNKVPGFANEGGHQLAQNTWEEKNATLTRISNLITTRSDSFTAYITIQGWRNAGGGGVGGKPPPTIKGLPGPAELVVQRRLIVVFDRSGVIYTTDYDPTIVGGNALPGHFVRDIKAMIMSPE